MGKLEPRHRGEALVLCRPPQWAPGARFAARAKKRVSEIIANLGVAWRLGERFLEVPDGVVIRCGGERPLSGGKRDGRRFWNAVRRTTALARKFHFANGTYKPEP